MVLTITNGHATIFSAGETFQIYGDDYSNPYIMDSDNTEYQVIDLITDGVEFTVTHD